MIASSGVPSPKSPICGAPARRCTAAEADRRGASRELDAAGEPATIKGRAIGTPRTSAEAACSWRRKTIMSDGIVDAREREGATLASIFGAG
eukprot:scaffold7423_cov118-Isochrysis_galbana.AAC.4